MLFLSSGKHRKKKIRYSEASSPLFALSIANQTPQPIPETAPPMVTLGQGMRKHGAIPKLTGTARHGITTRDT